MTKVIVIGAGASGLVAAIEAAKQGAKVTILEKNNKIGKKILVTGNGRCNITNLSMNVSNYRSENLPFVEKVLEKYTVSYIRDYFHNIGLLTKTIGNYVYPNTLQASSVVEKLTNKCISLGIKLALETECENILYNNGKFAVKTANYTYEADRVIVSSGLIAGDKINGDIANSKTIFATKLAKSFGHKVNNISPGLIGLKCKNKFFNKVSGVRWEAKVASYVEDEKVYEDIGELQFADYGISGIVVFQNSRFISKALNEGKKAEVLLDLMPEYTYEEFSDFLSKQCETFGYMTIAELLNGIFNNKLTSYILLNSGINEKIKAKDFAEFNKITDEVKKHRLTVLATRGFEFAQVCAGGISTDEIMDTMESTLVKGLYFTGEALDVDGMCGGYNLHFAFSTGIEAGRNAGIGE